MFKIKNFTHRQSFFSRYMKARYCTYNIHIHKYIVFYLCIIIKNDLSNQINDFKNDYIMQKNLHTVTLPSAVFLKIVLLHYYGILMLFCSPQLALVHVAAMNHRPSQCHGHHTVCCAIISFICICMYEVCTCALCIAVVLYAVAWRKEKISRIGSWQYI